MVPGVLPPLLVKEPPAPPSSHTADVAPPPNDPPNAVVVALWHIAGVAPPALAVGFGFTVNDLLAPAVPHEPLLAVNVRVTGVAELEDAV